MQHIYWDDLLFFKNLLKLEPNDNKIIFKKSSIFFKNKNEEVLFINKINKSEFYYDSIDKERAIVDGVVSLTGFALVGGPARQDHPKAIDALKRELPYSLPVRLLYQIKYLVTLHTS